MRFIVDIDSENDGVQTIKQCAAILEDTAKRLLAYGGGLQVRDANGNTIGNCSLLYNEDD